MNISKGASAHWWSHMHYQHHAKPNVDNVLAKVEAAGGKILQAKFSIGENGFVAYIQDTEGNCVGIHSME